MANGDRRGLRLDAYPRVSKVGGRDGEGFISVQVQTEGMQAWASANGHTLHMHEPELDVSGGRMDRPVFNKVMARIRSGETDGFVVYKVDRFARSLLGALNVLEEVAKAGGTFASVSDKVDMTTAQGRAFLHMQLVFAQLFREQIGESFDVATGRAVARGVHIANTVPAGYDRVDQRLVPNADAAVIRELFERRAAGQGCSSLARWLDTVLPRAGHEMWTPAHVSRMLTQRVYLGEAFYGEHRNRNAHAPIISEALFLRASDARAPSPPRSEKTHLLAGIVRCAGCRYLMAPSKSGRDGQTLTYRCRGKHTAGICPAPATISRGRLEDFVQEQALNAMATDYIATASGSEHAAAAAARDALRDELDLFAADTEARALLGDRYHAAMAARVDALAEADAAVASTATAETFPQVDRETWFDLPVSDRRYVLAQMADAVFVRKQSGRPTVAERTFIAWHGTTWDGHNDLPRRGKVNGPVRPVVWPHLDREIGTPPPQDLE